MDSVTHKITADLSGQAKGDKSWYDLGANFPNQLITGMSHTLELTVINGQDDEGLDIPVSLVGATSTIVDIKLNNSLIIETVLSNSGTIADNVISFDIPRDIIPAALAAFKQSDANPTILYKVTILDATNKLQFRKLLTILDEDGLGDDDATANANIVIYTPETPNDWPVEPESVGDALDQVKSVVDLAVTNLVDSAPGALDTLDELAAALGDDANFATTVTTALATNATAITAKLGNSGNQTIAGGLTLDSTTAGFKAPKMTTLERDAIVAPEAREIIFNTDDNELNIYTTSWGALGDGGGVSVAIIRDVKAAGTGGGTANIGNQTRTLNTIVSDPDSIISSLVANKFIPIAGRYLITASTTAFEVNRTRLKLMATTGGIQGIGASVYAHNIQINIGVSPTCQVSATFIADGIDSLYLEHYCQSFKATTGFGIDLSDGGTNTCADVIVIRTGDA